jgi:hypothetical protein
LTIAKSGWSSCWTTEKCCLKSKMSSTKHAGDLKMSQYALWSTCGEARLVHNHWKWWARELTIATSTYTGSPI